MAEVVFSPEARRDLLEILAYLTEAAGPQVARKYDSRIKRAIENLRAFPGAGAPRPELGRDVRLVILRPYLIVYRESARGTIVDVLRILDGRRNITTALLWNR